MVWVSLPVEFMYNPSFMNRDEAIMLLRSGPEGIQKWNRRRNEGENIPSLRGADLSRADLHAVDLRQANLPCANLRGADLSAANLRGASFAQADLRSANLNTANLRDAHFASANFFQANLTGANVGNSHLGVAYFGNANLTKVNFSLSFLSGTTFVDSQLSGANFTRSRMNGTILSALDLSEASGLRLVTFYGPCSVGVETLAKSKGRIPDVFLRGCGFQSWQIIAAKAYDPDLSADEFTNLQYEVINARNRGPIFIGGVFISYSHEDSKFVDKIHERLEGEGAPTWLDRHDLNAGDIQKQVDRAIRLNDIVLLVLSKSSVNSDWVKHELKAARHKELDEGRDVLCPVALDDEWKSKTNDVHWEPVFEKNVLDFSAWQTEEFESVYKKLVDGLKVNYGLADNQVE